MKKLFLSFTFLTLISTSCGMINDTINTLECNRQAIETSTQVIHQNADAILKANLSIEENRRQLEEINKSLKNASES